MLKPFLRDVLEDEESPRKRWFDVFILILVFASIGSYIVHVSGGFSGPTLEAALAFDIVATAIFALEYLARVYVGTDFRADMAAGGFGAAVRGKLRIMTRPIMVIDLIALLPAVRAFRIARLFRLLRVLRFAGAQTALAGFVDIFREHAYELLVVFGFMVAVLVAAGIAIFLVENPAEHPDSQIKDLGDGMWWAIVTMTTVGYGDKVPITGLGRVVAGFVVICGILVIAFPTAILTSAFTEKLARMREGKVRMESLEKHVVICGLSQSTRMIAREMSEFARAAHRSVDIVVIASYGHGEAPEGTALRRGDVTLERTLRDGGVPHAASVIVTAERRTLDQPPETIDARSILCAMNVAELAPNAFLVVEILVPENVPVLRKRVPRAEVIESGSIAPRLMAVATMHRGVNAVFSEILAPGGNDVYEVRMDAAALAVAPTFGDAARELRKTPAVVVSVRRGGVVTTNPVDGFTLEEGDALLVISETQPVLGARVAG